MVQKFYREKYGFQHGDFPVAERVLDQVLSLPPSPAIHVHDDERVIYTVRKVLGVCSELTDATIASGAPSNPIDSWLDCDQRPADRQGNQRD
jgi:hypothetical protein